MDSRILAGLGWFRLAVQALVVIAETDGACSITCAGYLDHPFLKNDTKQENSQAL